MRVFLALTAFALLGSPPLFATDPLEWPAVKAEMRPATYWWWPGNAVDFSNITKQMEMFKAAGLGGVHIIPIYGVKGAEARDIPYLSPKWMEMLRHTLDEGQRLGLNVDMTTGSGWCFGGPNVAPEDANALVVPETREVQSGQELKLKLDPKTLQAVTAHGPDGKFVDLTESVSKDGALSWKAEGGPWIVYVVSQKPSPQKVKRPSPGGEGPMLNLLYAEAMPRYLDRFTKAFENFPQPWPRAQYHDSYEYVSNWAPDFLARFELLRGYKLQTEFPALFAKEASDRAARVQCDYRETVSDIMAEESLPLWTKWAHDHGMITRNQAHGSPGNLLDLYAAADIPETEMFHLDRNKLVSKVASSAAHVTGKPLVSSETGTWLKEHFTETLEDMKRLQDDLFLSGVNHIFYHGCCYSPEDAAWPGWLFYASYEMNPRNPVWHDVGALNAYATRVQSVLQDGRPAADILLYWPIHSTWQRCTPLEMKMTVHARAWLEDQPFGQAAARLYERGYDFDYVSDRMLDASRCEESKIVLKQNSYRTVVVPKSKMIPLETIEKFASLAQDGCTIIFEDALPDDVPGWGKLDERRAKLGELLSGIKLAPVGPGQAQEARTGNGKGRFLVGPLEACLAEAKVARESLADRPGLHYVRRRIEGGRNYFLVNQGEQAIDGWVPLALGAQSAVLFDPLTGRRAIPALKPDGEDRTLVRLQLAPGASTIVRVFSGQEALAPPSTLWAEGGPPVEIHGNWNVSFVSGGPALAAAYTTDALAPWSARDDEACRNFSGTVRYSITFAAPAAEAAVWHLDLGTVHQSARITLNGESLGVLFMAPMRVPLPSLRPAGNELTIEVTSTAANRIRDLDRRQVEWRIFRDINFVNLDYKPFDASKWETTPSGLEGPVRLVPMKATLP